MYETCTKKAEVLFTNNIYFNSVIHFEIYTVENNILNVAWFIITILMNDYSKNIMNFQEQFLS